MWALLRGPDDWEEYVRNVATSHGLINRQVNWGHGPQEYPALVSSYVPPINAAEMPRVISAYAYRADAACLFPYAEPADAGAGHPEVAGARLPDQKKFNRWVAAELLTVVHYLVETRICKPEQFESKLVEFLDHVREWHGEDRKKLAARLGRAELSVLESLGPDT